MNETDAAWPQAWVRAALGTAVLAVLQDGPLHGYGIANQLAVRGFGRPKGGSLYPLLNRLESEDALHAYWESQETGPGRRTYALTDAGHARLMQERGQWASLIAALNETTPIKEDILAENV